MSGGSGGVDKAEEWKPAESVEAVRKELRSALFGASFGISIGEVNQSDTQQEVARQRLLGFAYFGVMSGLVTPEEGNDWGDVAWGRKDVLAVLEKYDPDNGE